MVMAVGVDGCRGGWFWVAGEGHGLVCGVAASIGELVESLPEDSRIFIDIPIGLLEGGTEGRLCDIGARRLLGPGRGSSVFPAPYRPVLAAHSYEQAKQISRQVSGRMLSRQAWFISPRIREVDDYLAANPALVGRLREVHPELAFWGLNQGWPMVHGKKTRPGFEERLGLLVSYLPAAPALVELALDRYRRKVVARDDILDALVNLVLAMMPEQDLLTVPPQPPRDARGLAMEIVHPSLKA